MTSPFNFGAKIIDNDQKKEVDPSENMFAKKAETMTFKRSK